MQNFLLKKIIEQKLKDIPKDEQEKFMKLFEKNPEFFQKLAAGVHEEMQKGATEMDALFSVVAKYKDELKGLVQ